MQDLKSKNIPLIESYYREHRQRLVKRLTFRSGTVEDAEDIVQESFARALKYCHRVEIGDVHRWFSLITTNALRDHMRNATGLSYVDEENTTEETVECRGYPERIMYEIREIIDTKADSQQEILTLHIFEEYSAKEISEITPYSYAQVHKTISRFREELRTLYKD